MFCSNYARSFLARVPRPMSLCLRGQVSSPPEAAKETIPSASIAKREKMSQDPLSPPPGASLDVGLAGPRSVSEPHVVPDLSPPPPSTGLQPEPGLGPRLLPRSDTKAVLDVTKQQEDLLRLASPFDEVPGPEILRVLARVWGFLPVISNQITASAMVYFVNMLGATLTWNRPARPFIHMFDKYGPVVRLQGVFGGDIVFLARPEHIETVYRQEGKYPLRSALDSLEKYRMKHRRLRVPGPFIMAGPEWEALRTKLETPLHRSVVEHSGRLETAADELVTRIAQLRNRQEEVPAGFSKEIYKWALECVALVVLDHRLGCLDGDQPPPGSEAAVLLDAVQEASGALRRCESGFQIWRFVETPAWKQLVASCEIIDGITAKHIRSVEARLRGPGEFDTGADSEAEGEPGAAFARPLIDSLLLDGSVHPDDLLTAVLDMLLIGVNATAHALGFLLYHLAVNPRVQRTLHEEVVAALPYPDSHLSYADVHKMCYLHACVRESLRMRPPIPVITRVLPKDVAIHNYRIPKGTIMLMTSHVSAMKEENFEDATKFKPERWLNGDRDIHPFAAIPFGHGPRSCLGRNLAEIQLWMITAKIIRAYRIEYHYGTINASTRLIAMPDKPLKFRFVDRNI